MRNFLFGFLVCLITISSIAAPYFWPPELSLVFDSTFWTSVLMFANSCMLVGYLYIRGGSTQGAQFFFAIMLIISASAMYTGFEEIAKDIANWEPYLRASHPTVFVLLPQFVSYTKNMVSFGFAALGASVAANIITNKRSFKS